MCGIAGILNFKYQVVKDDLKKMTDSIVHRGPDGEGQWINSTAQAGLGHRRLSIIDLSDAGKQPMHYADNRYTITFNGEIYNYVELKSKLTSKGYRFYSNTDTEVLLALYDLKKEKCLDDLDGMFAFAIWDEKEKKLFCARDRFGEKPFYYYKNREQFVFASEMKALFAIGIPREIMAKRIYFYMGYNTEVNPHDISETFFKDIFQLEPGHFFILGSDGNFQKKKYWEINTSQEINISFEKACDKFYELFFNSVRLRLRSDVPVGSSLSGGLDSSAIVLLIDQIKKQGQAQKTFSARFKNFSKDEGKYMDLVINKAKNVEPYYTWPTEDDLINEFDKLYEHQEEPFGSASIFAQWKVMKLARENNVTVLIDGQGADEVLAGYKPFYTSYLNQLYKNFDKTFMQEKRKALEFHNVKFTSSLRTKILLRYPSVFSLGSKTAKVIGVKKKETSRLLNLSGFDAGFAAEVAHFARPVIQENDDHLKNSQRNVIQRLGFLTLLRYADRNSMAFSREVRVPFLSHELVNFVFSLPDNFKLKDGWTKFILRKSMEKTLPSEITWRREKIGYEPPQKKWLATPLLREKVVNARENLVKERLIKPDNKFTDWQCLVISKLLN